MGKEGSYSEKDDLSRSGTQSRMTVQSEKELEQKALGTSSRLFMVLLACEGPWPNKVVWLGIAVEYMQIAGLMINPHMFHRGASFFPDVVYWSHLPAFDSAYSSLSHLGYSALLWLAVLMLFVVFCMMVLISQSLTEKKPLLGEAVRILVTCLATWLYIPLLHCICTLMICTDGEMWMFPDVSCSSASRVAHAVAAFIVFLFYVPSVYMVRQCVYEASPNSKYFCAKGHTLVDACKMFFETVAVFLFHIILGSGTDAVVYSTCIFIGAFVMIIIYGFALPYFHKRMNAIAVSEWCILCAAALVHMVCSSDFLSSEPISGMLLLGLLPVVGLLGFALGGCRINPELIQALEMSERGERAVPEQFSGWHSFAGLPICDDLADTSLQVNMLFKPHIDTASRVSQSESSRQDVVLLPYICKVYIQSDVEVASRTLTELSRRSEAESQFNQVHYTLHFFTKGLVRFRYSAVVKLQYVWFLFAIAERPQVAYSFFDTNDDAVHVFTTSAALQDKYNQHKVTEKLKKRLNIKERHFEIYGRKAVLLHEEVLDQMYQFWQRLMELSVDMMEVGSLASSIAENRDTGLALFKRALTGDTRMLINFADYLDGVMLNKEAAKMCLEEVQELDVEKKSRQMGGSRKAVEAPIDGNSVVQRVLDNVASQKDTFGTTASNTVRKLSLNMNVVFALLTLLVVGNLISEFITVDVQLSIIDKMDAAGQARMLSLKATYEIYDLFYYLEQVVQHSQAGGLTTIDTQVIDRHREAMLSTAKRFADVHNKLTYGSQSTTYGPHVRYYEEPLNEILVGGEPHLESLWEVGNRVMGALHAIQLNLTTDVLVSLTAAASAETVSTQANALAVTNRLMTNPAVRFMLVNAPERIALTYNRSVQYYEEEADHRLDVAMTTLVAIFVVSTVVTFAIYFLFLWNFKKITVSKLIILQLFTLIPYDTLARLSADAKELVNSVRGLSKNRTKKLDTGLPTALIIEIEKALHGEDIEEPTSLATLEKYLQDRKVLKDSAVATKLKQYIKIVKNKAVALDPEVLLFVRNHIINAPPPLPCLKLHGDKGSKAEPGSFAVGFKGKTIVGNQGANDDDEVVSVENTSEKDVDDPDIDIPSVPQVRQEKDSKKQPELPLLFWMQNLLLVVVGMVAFALLLTAHGEASTMRSFHRDHAKLMRHVQGFSTHLNEVVTDARRFAQYGDARFYIRVADTLNKQLILFGFEGMVDAGATTHELDLLVESRGALGYLLRQIRASAKLAAVAFNKPIGLVVETRDTVWEAADDSLLLGQSNYDVILKYPKLHTPSTTKMQSSEDTLGKLPLLAHAEAARSKVFASDFIHSEEVITDELNQVIAMAAQVPSDLKDKAAIPLVAAAVLMLVAAILALSTVHTLRTSTPLAVYKGSSACYTLAALGLTAFSAIILSKLELIGDTHGKIRDGFAYERDTYNYIRACDIESSLSERFVQSTTGVPYNLHPAYLYKKEVTENADRRWSVLMSSVIRYVDNVERERRLGMLRQKLRQLELIALSVIVKPENGIEDTTDKLQLFLTNVTWNISMEPDFFETLRNNPFCAERERGCRVLMHSDELSDLNLDIPVRRELARETMFTSPYTSLRRSFQEELQEAREEALKKTHAGISKAIDDLESHTLIMTVLSGIMLGVVVVGCTSFIIFILIQLAGNQGKQKNQLDSPLLIKLLFRCRVSLLLMTALIAVIFAVGVFAVDSTRDQAADLNLVSAREWVIARCMVYANIVDTSSSEAQGIGRQMLADLVVFYAGVRDRLYFGDPGTSEYNLVATSTEQSDLMFGPDKTDAADAVLGTYLTDECGNAIASPAPVPVYANTLNTVEPPMPLDLAIDGWIGRVRELLGVVCPATSSACTPRDGVLLRLRDTVGPIIDSLEESGNLHETRARDAVQFYSLISRLIFGVTLTTILLLYNLVFRKMLSQLTHEENGTKGVLKMIPQQVIESVAAISEYLETGKVDNTEQLAKNFEQSERLLANILPENISKRLKSGESPIADTHASITILFTDFVGFTSISSSLSAVEIISFLNEVFIEFDLIAELLGLEKIKTIGDAYFMAGGLKPSVTDHAVRVVEASMLMYQALEEHNQRHPDRKELQMRLGCHTGPAVAGCIGVKKVAYDLWGESVQMAEKMESGGVPGRIHISPTTEEEVREMYTTESRACPKVTFTTYLISGRKQPTAYMHLVWRMFLGFVLSASA